VFDYRYKLRWKKKVTKGYKIFLLINILFSLYTSPSPFLPVDNLCLFGAGLGVVFINREKGRRGVVAVITLK